MRKIVDADAPAMLAGDTGSRQFADLIRLGLVVYWAPQQLQPPRRVIDGCPGVWCLTFDGEAR